MPGTSSDGLLDFTSSRTVSLLLASVSVPVGFRFHGSQGGSGPLLAVADSRQERVVFTPEMLVRNLLEYIDDYTS